MSGKPREWGPWSVWKNELILGAYVNVFTRAGKRSRHRTFIDGFAGSAQNVERYTNRPILSSPEIALGADPEFTHLILFELPDKANALRTKLAAEYLGRNIEVVGGDCNAQMAAGLQWWKSQETPQESPHLGQALAYLDPNNNLDLKWSTVEMLAQFERTKLHPAYRTRNNPIEQLILFPVWGLRNRLHVKPGTAYIDDESAQMVSDLFGCDDWTDIYEDQRSGVLNSDAAWRHYVELYRCQLRSLGYEHVMAIETRNTKNVMQYHLVFASNHDAGGELMRSVMSKARTLLPAKLAESRDLKRNGVAQARLPGLEAELENMQAQPEDCVGMMSHAPSPYVQGSGSDVPIDPVLPPKRKKRRRIDQPPLFEHNSLQM